ncbi:MAG: hypothetical protein ABL929_06890 [Ferruginibacter sp.]|nr:hypothetical protein [Ferruginibacter sp.]
MFEQLLELVKSQSGEAIVNNPAVPNEHNEAVMNEATNSITSTLQGLLSSGGSNGIAQVLNMFSNQNAGADVNNHPVAQTMSSNLVSSLMSKFGIGGQQAGGIASMLLPMVLNKLIGGSSNTGGGLNIQSLFNGLSGGKTGGMDIGSLVAQFGGNALDKNHDGHVDLQDLMAAFTGGGAQQQQQQQQQPTAQTGGGILDALTGLLGKS